MRIREHVNLREYNTFQVSAHAAWFSEVGHLTDLVALLRSGISPMLILGEGSNVLFTANFPGLIIKTGFKGRSWQPDSTREGYANVEVAAGENWSDFVYWTIGEGLGGLENLSLIPGTAGAAPIQNIGAYGVELADVLSGLEAYDILEGKLRRLDTAECEFGYRNSRFKQDWKGRFVITRLFFSLTRENHCLHTAYGNLEVLLSTIPSEKRTPRAVSGVVTTVRRSKLPDPAVTGNAGSFFKNPEIGEDKLLSLQQEFPDLNYFPIAGGRYKLPAAWLLERSGWKGKQLGRVACHGRQPLVLVNKGKASGTEIVEFAIEVARDIRRKFGLRLEPEVNIYPPDRWPEDI